MTLPAGGMKTRVLGSVPMYAVQHGNCPVLVVNPQEYRTGSAAAAAAVADADAGAAAGAADAGAEAAAGGKAGEDAPPSPSAA